MRSGSAWRLEREGEQVLALVVRGAMRPVVAGLALGVIGAFFAARLLGTLLFHVQPGDPLVLAGIAGMLGGVGNRRIARASAASFTPRSDQGAEDGLTGDRPAKIRSIASAATRGAVLVRDDASHLSGT